MPLTLLIGLILMLPSNTGRVILSSCQHNGTFASALVSVYESFAEIKNDLFDDILKYGLR